MQDLGAQHAELWSLLDGLAPAEWAAATPCEGWDVADVVLHLRQTDELALASLRGDLEASIETFMRDGDDAVDAAAAASVEDARGFPVWRSGRSGARRRRRSGSCSPRPTRARGSNGWSDGSAPGRWPRRGSPSAGSTPRTSPGPSATRSNRPTGSGTWPGSRGGRCPTRSRRPARSSTAPSGSISSAPSGAAWRFGLDDEPRTVVRGPGVDLCRVAGRRVEPAATALVATGPDADAVLALVRTYA